MLNHLHCNVLSGHLPPLIKVRGVNMSPLNREKLELYPSEFVTSDSLSTAVRVIWLVVYAGVMQIGRGAAVNRWGAMRIRVKEHC